MPEQIQLCVCFAAFLIELVSEVYYQYKQGSLCWLGNRDWESVGWTECALFELTKGPVKGMAFVLNINIVMSLVHQQRPWSDGNGCVQSLKSLICLGWCFLEMIQNSSFSCERESISLLCQIQQRYNFFFLRTSMSWIHRNHKNNILNVNLL